MGSRIDGNMLRFDDVTGTIQHTEDLDVKDVLLIRPSGACVDCKSVKVRCEFVPGERKCRRCQTKSLPCQPRERKKRKPADTHEQLQEKALEKDMQIQALLQQYDRLKSDQNIRHWVEKASSTPVDGAVEEHGRITGRIQPLEWDYKGKTPETATLSYFAGKQSNSHLSLPPIVQHCELYPEDILTLFTLYFNHIDPFFSVLDVELHTAENLIFTCPFLFTVICAVASRYYTNRPNIYPLAMDFARDTAGQMLVDGNQSVDVCQAYLIMAVYPAPRKRWAEDRSWLLMGVAIRMSVELGLDQPPPSSLDERQKLNRIRTWLNCYCVDGSHAIQFGKMPMVRLDDFLARSSQGWYKSSPMNTAFDVHLCAYVQILIIMSDWRRQLNLFERGQQYEGFDIVAVSFAVQQKLSDELKAWVTAYNEEYNYTPLLICNFRSNTTQMITAYLRLVVLAAAFQHSLKRGLKRDSEVFKTALDAAKTVISIMVERLYPTGHLRFAMEASFLYVAYAAAFLANLLRPKFLPLLDEKQQREIIYLVTHLIDVLRSRDVALDGRHTPASYSKFLASLMERHNVREMRFSSTEPSEFNTQYLPQYGPDRPFTPPHLSSWPDTSFITNTSPTLFPDVANGIIFQQRGEAEMDLSLNFFVKTVSRDFSLPSTSTSTSTPDTVQAISTGQGWQSTNATQWASQTNTSW